MRLSRFTGMHVLRVFRRPLRKESTSEGRVLSLRELLAFCADRELDLREAMVRDAYARGDLCVGAFAGAALAGYAWFSHERAPHRDGVWVDVPRDAVYRYKVFVRPALRRRGVASALYAAGDALAARPGKRFLVTCVELHNRASIAASLKAGDAPLGWLAYWRFMDFFFSYHDPEVRKHGPRFRLTREEAAGSAAASRTTG